MNPFLFRRITGPVLLLTFAVTAMLSQWHILSFAASWPLYLIVFGVLHFFEAVLPLPAYVVNPQLAGLPRRRSLVGALLEIVIGVLFLLFTTDTVPAAIFWHDFSLWWPLLLVVVGLLLLVERLFDRGYERRIVGAGGYLPRRRRGGGLFVLIVLLIALGVSSRHIGMLPGENWHWDPDWSWSLGGEEHDNNVALAELLPADAVLTIDNAHGDLQLATSTDGRIHVDAHQEAHVSGRDAERAFADTRPRLVINGTSASVTVPGRSGVDVRLVLAVPEGVLCTVHNHHGDIAISGLRRAVEITQDHGDVAVDSIGSNVHVSMDHGNVTAHGISGDLAVDGRAEDISASGVKGQLQLNGEFFGTTEVDGLDGLLAFHSNRTQLDAQHVTGSVSIDSDDLRISGVEHGLKLVTRSKEVEVTGLKGDATITDNNSDVSVSAVQPLGAITINNSTGDITLSVPTNASFSLSGATGSDDEIRSDFPLVQNTSGGDKTLTGQVGQGGPHLSVTTRHGDITLHKGSDTDEAAPPAPPAVPEHTRATHARHLEPPSEPVTPTVQ